MSVVLCGSEQDFDEHARSWSPGDPFPLLSGPSVGRYHRLLAKHGVSEWPQATGWRAEGVVVSVGGDIARGVGRLLGVATGRPYEHVASAELANHVRRHRDDLVAVVGLADDLGVTNDWPGAWAPRVGVVTARDGSSLACLAYRTLTVDAVTSERDFLVTHPSSADADEADANGLDELDGLGEVSIRTLTLRGHGAECAINLPDGVICGRSDYLGIPLPIAGPGVHVPSCLRDGRCFRADLDEDQRLQAAELDARVVFVHSCSSVALGNELYPSAMGLGLGFLSGSAVAVIGSVGMHIGHVSFRHEFDAAMVAGLSMGDVLHRLNRYSGGVWGELSQFGLFGDPSLVSSRFGGRTVSAPQPITRDSSVLRILSHWNDVVIPRLARLAWLDLDVSDVDGLREQIRESTRRNFVNDDESVLDGLAAELLTVQEKLVAQLAQQVHHSWWQFESGLISGLRLESNEACVCTVCGEDRAVVTRLRHEVEKDLLVSMIQCRRCGRLLQWTGAEPNLFPPNGNIEARQGTPTTIGVSVTNPASAPAGCSVGFGLVAGQYLGLPEPEWKQLELGPGETREIDWSVEVKGTQLRLDDYLLVFMSLSEGTLTTAIGRFSLVQDLTEGTSHA